MGYLPETTVVSAMINLETGALVEWICGTTYH